MSFNELVRKYTLQPHDKIKKICAPLLAHFGVNHFWYHVVTNDGRYGCIGSNAAWMEYYFGEELYKPNPYLRNPKQQQSGLSAIRKVADPAFQVSIDKGLKSFNLNQSLVMLEKIPQGISGFGFATCLPLEAFEERILYELPLVQLFTKQFSQEFLPLMKKMHGDLVDLLPHTGKSFFDPDTALDGKRIDRKRYLKELGIHLPSRLSPRQQEVLLYLPEGYSAGQIAALLGLSKRTVEGYIEMLKSKLGCMSKIELIEKANQLKLIGF